MKKIKKISVVIGLFALLYIFPIAVQTQGTPYINAGATPPLGVVRDGDKYWVWNFKHIGIVIGIEGVLLLILFQRDEND